MTIAVDYCDEVGSGTWARSHPLPRPCHSGIHVYNANCCAQICICHAKWVPCSPNLGVAHYWDRQDLCCMHIVSLVYVKAFVSVPCRAESQKRRHKSHLHYRKCLSMFWLLPSFFSGEMQNRYMTSRSHHGTEIPGIWFGPLKILDDPMEEKK